MAEAAHSSQLKQAFQEHFVQTQGHVSRLEQIFRELNMDPKRETCAAMKGLIAEGDEMIKAKGNSDVKDAALIAAGQRVEHYEISGYGTARSFARRLGLTQAASLLQQTLQEEKATDEKLNTIAESSVNPQAAGASASSASHAGSTTVAAKSLRFRSGAQPLLHSSRLDRDDAKAAVVCRPGSILKKQRL